MQFSSISWVHLHNIFGCV